LFYKEGCYIVVHVDDFLATGEPETVAKYRRILHQTFAMTGGRAEEYYGLELTHSADLSNYEIGCGKYIDRMLTKLDIKPRIVHTPAAVDQELPHIPGECPDRALQRRYRQIVGCVMHPAVTCRPDVACAVKNLCMHLNHPDERHVRAAERVASYLHTTRDRTLRYGIEGSVARLYGTSDAAFNVTHDSRSVTGWCYHLNGGAISWKCRNQNLVTLSSTESELIAADEAVRELRFLHKLLVDFDLEGTEEGPTVLGQDNMSTIALIRARHFNARTRHVALRYHHVGDLQREGTVLVRHLSTNQMTADVLTKGLDRTAHERHTRVLLGHQLVQWDSLPLPGKEQQSTE